MTNEGDHPGGLTLRAATEDDVPELARLLDAASRRWVGRATTEEQVVDRLATPGTDRRLDTVCAVASDGALAGFGHVWPASPDELRCFARTHPERTGQGVGMALQRRLVARAEELAGAASPDHPMTLTTTSWPSDRRGDELLSAAGYVPARYYLKMVISFAEQDPRLAPTPGGVTVRPFAEGDEEDLFAAYAESFAEHWGEHTTPEQWWGERRDAEAAGFDPGLWLVALEGAELVGFAVARTFVDREGETYGYVGDLGVRPRWRGRGLGERLLSASLAIFRERGLPYATLDVDAENTTGAVRLYTKVGMVQQPSFTIWTLGLRRG